MTIRSLTTAVIAAGALVLAAGTTATASTTSSTSATNGTSATTASEPQLIHDEDLKAQSITMGGAKVLPTTKTIPHWYGTTKDPSNGVTYGYNMVGSNPHTCTGAACDVTVQVDIIPIKVVIGRETFDGSDVVAPTLGSPQFANNDYGTTPAATDSAFKRGPGGALSQADAGVPLQLQDATMRAQFAKTGGSSYHLRPHPNVLAPVTITVPSNPGGLIESGHVLPMACTGLDMPR